MTQEKWPFNPLSPRDALEHHYTSLTVFLALRKVRVRQYEDSDSKHGVGVSTQRGFRQNATVLQECPGILFFREEFRWLLVISKGTFQALQQLIFH